LDARASLHKFKTTKACNTVQQSLYLARHFIFISSFKLFTWVLFISTICGCLIKYLQPPVKKWTLVPRWPSSPEIHFSCGKANISKFIYI
jgi:hypothetical protein